MYLLVLDYRLDFEKKVQSWLLGCQNLCRFSSDKLLSFCSDELLKDLERNWWGLKKVLELGRLNRREFV
ncbi:hypothetical protein VNO77_33769 [Canavalia gladiata]|uniref:Uncharacterized protein n=1 Tax=Canavalia gladiata TaxID=3824 RepID=A0AAN9KFI1_CANGL